MLILWILACLLALSLFDVVGRYLPVSAYQLPSSYAPAYGSLLG